MDSKHNMLADLHKVYRAGNLRILAGAGVSIQSEIPDWETLNFTLLRSYLAETLQLVASHQISPESSLADQLAKDVYERLGRDAVAELVLKSCETEDEFRTRLADALYQGRTLENLYLSDLQKQIASLTVNPRTGAGAGKGKWAESGPNIASIFTTNFDPLLEMAIARACIEGDMVKIEPDVSVSFKHFRLPKGASDDPMTEEVPKVKHLHGWIDPEGEAGGQVVYAESHYFRLQREESADANLQTRELFDKTGATLIIGMSLSDPNLRRLLYSRSSEGLINSAASIYSFMRQGDRGLASGYAAKFWELLKVKLIPFYEYSELPDLIRQIQWGVSAHEAPKWFEASAHFSGIKLDKVGLEQWDEFAAPLLTSLHRQIARMYITQAREEVSVTFFAPTIQADGSAKPFLYELGFVDSAGQFEAKSAVEIREIAKLRNLDVRRDKVQGLAGLAFVEGAMKEATDENNSGLDFNFSEEMRTAFDRGSYRAWRSMLAVPILGGPFWLPLGVICIHSNFGRPFWKRLQHKPLAFANFTNVLLKAGRVLLVPKKQDSAAN